MQVGSCLADDTLMLSEQTHKRLKIEACSFVHHQCREAAVHSGPGILAHYKIKIFYKWPGPKKLIFLILGAIFSHFSNFGANSSYIFQFMRQKVVILPTVRRHAGKKIKIAWNFSRKKSTRSISRKLQSAAFLNSIAKCTAQNLSNLVSCLTSKIYQAENTTWHYLTSENFIGTSDSSHDISWKSIHDSGEQLELREASHDDDKVHQHHGSLLLRRCPKESEIFCDALMLRTRVPNTWSRLARLLIAWCLSGRASRKIWLSSNIVLLPFKDPIFISPKLHWNGFLFADYYYRGEMTIGINWAQLAL